MWFYLNDTEVKILLKHITEIVIKNIEYHRKSITSIKQAVYAVASRALHRPTCYGVDGSWMSPATQNARY